MKYVERFIKGNSELNFYDNILKEYKWIRYITDF